MLRHLLALALKEFLAVLRDKRSRFVLIVPPIVQLLVFGYAATFDLDRVPVAIYNQDPGAPARELIALRSGRGGSRGPKRNHVGRARSSRTDRRSVGPARPGPPNAPGLPGAKLGAGRRRFFPGRCQRGRRRIALSRVPRHAALDDGLQLSGDLGRELAHRRQ